MIAVSFRIVPHESFPTLIGLPQLEALRVGIDTADRKLYPLEFGGIILTKEIVPPTQKDLASGVDLTKTDAVNVNLDYKQMGLGGDNSWGARPHEQYRLNPGEYTYSFRLSPITGNEDLMERGKLFYE